jgi:hypothetical protein
MTPRILANARVRLALGVLMAGCCLLAISGCDPRTLAYFLQPFDPTVAPPCETSFEGKKIVILCRAVADSTGDYSSLERDVSREVAKIFRQKVKKITVVQPDKVATWVEAHPHWTDPADAARDFNADIAIFLEVEQFQLESPGDVNMLHGEAKVHIKVFEMDYPKNSKDKPIKDQPKEAREIYNEYVETSFPNRGPLQIDSGNSRSAFKNTFLRIVTKEISWHFVEHAPDDSIQDSRIER